MKEIKLECSTNLNDSPMLENPVYEFESNYRFTSKYSRWRKVVHEASVTVLLLYDRIALIPRSCEGTRIVDALKKLIGLESDKIIPSAQSAAVGKNGTVSDYVDKFISLLSNFDADGNFGLYGFFAYELINMKLGVCAADMPIGIFFLPEIMSVNHGPVFRYSMAGARESEPKFGEWLTSKDGIFFDLSKFAKGESGVYEHLYDFSQNDIKSRKIISINPSFTVSKSTAISSYEVGPE
jgi:hypothetical protein